MGRRWGKTILGGACALSCARLGGKAAWIVPTYKNGRPLWRWAEQATADARKAGAVTTNKTERIIEFAYRRGFLGIYSADNEDAMRGEAFNLAIVDEAARIDETVWADVLQPTLADAGGQAFLISTPKGRNWFWREWQRADGVRQARWQASSRENPNPRIQAAYDLARTRVAERTFLQEWDAQFLDDAGGVFRRVRAAATALPQERALPEHSYIMGVDWGKHEDFTVLTVLDATMQSLVHLDRFNQIDYQVQLGRLRALAARFEPEAIIAEANSMGEPLVEQLRQSELPVQSFTTTNASKARAIEALALAFEQGELAIIDDPVLADELESYTYDRLPSGATRYSAPPGMHDDCVMSLALAWSGCDVAAGDWGLI